jgi:elongation factor P hydroxylase
MRYDVSFNYEWIMHTIEDLITIFNECFEKSHNTILVRGDDEPIYLPSSDEHPSHRVIFAHGFFASALHESSHWLIAGEQRRKLIDFGYWYVPDGRSGDEQKLFEKVEIKPQALEWILSKACGFPFRISLDNLNGGPEDTENFKMNIYNQVKLYLEKGLPERAKTLKNALCSFYKTSHDMKLEDFDINTL